MKKFRKLRIVVIILLITMMPVQGIYNSNTVLKVEAHSGRTDSNGGHKDNKNKSGLGSYHYHCGGYPAHLHKNGICPYKSSSTSSSESKNSSKSESSTTKKKTEDNSTQTSKAIIKKVQTALNDLGYDCGKADGLLGKKTTKALKEFQKDNDLTVDGKIGKQVKTALGIE